MSDAEQHELRSRDVWPDSDADGLREYVCKEWPQLARALDIECGILEVQ